MPFMMNDYYSAQSAALANQIKQQVIAENQIKLDEQQRIKDEEAKARAILTEQANAPKPTSSISTLANLTQPSAPTPVPTEMKPQEGLTGFGGMSTPQEGPVGLKPAEGLTGFGGMQVPQEPAAAPTEAPTSPVAKAQEAAKSYQVAQSEFDQIKENANKLRKQGLHDAADRYEEKQTKLITSVETAKINHLKAISALSEHMAELGNGYLDVLKTPGVDKEVAWQRLLMKAASDGYPIDDLINTSPDQREAKISQIVGEAVTTKDRIKESIASDRIASKEKSERQLLDFKLKNSAWNREFKEKQEKGRNDRFAFKALYSDVSNQIKVYENQRGSLDKDINMYNDNLQEFQKGNTFLSVTGQPITSNDPKVRETEASRLHDALVSKQFEKEEINNAISELGSKRTSFVQGLSKAQQRELGTSSSTSTESPTPAPTQTTPGAMPVAQAVAYIKENDTPENRQHFKDTYPDQDLDALLSGKQPATETAPAKPEVVSARQAELKKLQAAKPKRKDFPDTPEGAGQFVNAITNWNSKYQALANPTIGQRASETYKDWFVTKTPDVVKDKNGDIISEEPGLEGSHPELLFIGGGKGAQILVSKFGRPFVNSLGRLGPKFAEKANTPEYVKVLEKVQSRFNSSEGFNVLRGANYESKITVKELNKFTAKNIEKDAAAGNAWAKGIIEDAENFIGTRQATQEEIKQLILRSEAKKLKEAAFAQGEQASAAEYESIENLAYRELKSLRAAQRRTSKFKE